MHHGSPAASPEALLDTNAKLQSWNPMQPGSYRRHEQVRERENDRGYRDSQLERERKNAGVMIRLERIPDKQLESLFDCDEGTY